MRTVNSNVIIGRKNTENHQKKNDFNFILKEKLKNKPMINIKNRRPKTVQLFIIKIIIIDN